MKLVIKNGYKFVTGMLWQIPDEGKRSIPIKKIAVDTKNNMVCNTKSITPTWGFCNNNALKKSKAASLGVFILESSNLSSAYKNVIICYKFKSAPELDESNRELINDLYGYLVILNGTICPDDGEYVAEFELVKESILTKINKYEIQVLYLTTDVASRFFNIFERLNDAKKDKDHLHKILSTLTESQINQLTEYINAERYDYNARDLSNYKMLLPNEQIYAIENLIEIIDNQKFIEKINSIKSSIRYLFESIRTIAYTSDEIYWNSPKFKSNYKKALINPISFSVFKEYRKYALLCGFVISAYIGYGMIQPDDKPLKYAPVILENKPLPIDATKLISTCLRDNDRFFKDMGTWSLTDLQCNSLGYTLNFKSEIDTTTENFVKLVNSKDVSFSNMIGTYTKKFHLSASPSKPMNQSIVINTLQENSIKFGYKLIMSNKAIGKSNQFTINSGVSPVYLLNHGVFNNIKLKTISVAFNSGTGLYNWNIQGEF